MNNPTLAELQLKWAEIEEPLQLGKFNPDLIPKLDLKSFNGTMKIGAAVSPDCGFRLLKAAMESAQTSLDIYIYNISAEHIIEIIEAKVAAGVKVRLMYDPHDSGKKEYDRLSQIDKLDFQTAPTYQARSAFTVCHQKFVVVDVKEVFLGSANWAGTSFPNVTDAGVFKKGNREWIVRINDAGVAGWFADLFQADWDIQPIGAGLFQLEVPQVMLEPGVAPGFLASVPDTVFDIEERNEETGVTPVVSPDNYFDEVLNAIKAATISIDVQQQDIKAKFDEEAKVDLLLRELGAQRKAGITVRILVSPKFSWDLSQDSVDAYELGDCLKALNLKYFTHLHNKGIVFDRKKVLVTSTNWTENSITKAREAGVLIENTNIAEYYAKTFDLDWEMGLGRDAVPQHLIDVGAQLQDHPDTLVQMDSVPPP